jgi:hypothetical protein
MIRAYALCLLLAILTFRFTPVDSQIPTASVSKFPQPWAAACKVTVNLRANLANGGSGTLIGVTQNEALVLTVAHVAERVNQTATCQWGDQKCHGYVLAVSPTADLALILVERPVDIAPVPVAHATPENGPYYMAGFPGYDRDTLRYQRGNYADSDHDTLVITCRPEKGMSGGPTFDRYGRVVGAVSAYGPRYGYAGDGDALQALVEAYLK